MVAALRISPLLMAAYAIPLLRKETNDNDFTISNSVRQHFNEAEHLRRQFDGLDSRFSEAARLYMSVAGSALREQTQQIKHAKVSISSQELETVDGPVLRDQTHQTTRAVESLHKGLLEDASTKALAVKPQSLDYGFYVHAFFEVSAVVRQLRSIRHYYPEAPIYIASDGGANFSQICKKIANCTFTWRAPAHARWNPKPFLDRFHDAAMWLQEKHVDWIIYLEPDVTLHKRAVYKVEGDAGGLRDVWSTPLPNKLRTHLENLGKHAKDSEGHLKRQFKIIWDRCGLNGGSIIRTYAAVTAFKPDTIDWAKMEALWDPSVYASDMAMLIALATYGFNYSPWSEVKQGTDSSQPRHPTAFVHHSDEPASKPPLGIRLSKEDLDLVGPPPPNMKPLESGQCHHCVWVDEHECWPADKANGVIQCPTGKFSWPNRSVLDNTSIRAKNKTLIPL